MGNSTGERFAVTRRCRHLGADLAKGSIDRDGCLVCWRGARYDITTGRMRRARKDSSPGSPVSTPSTAG